MKEFLLDKRIYDKVNKTILISGCARSGTTIIGKIIHSMQDVEYVLEPPMMFTLFPLLNVLRAEQWKLLYETYLYEEFLMNAIAGRAINCNRVDDSSIYNCKSEQLIEKRLNCSLRKFEAERKAHISRIAFKTPSLNPFLQKLKKYYPGTIIVIMTRKAPEVLNSILEHKWFSTKMLEEENLYWPNRFMGNTRVPFWVSSEDDEKWCEMDELHRIAYYYIRMNQSIRNIPKCIVVKYDELIENPSNMTNLLAEKLGLVWGDKTEHIIGSVSRRKRSGRDCNVLKKLNKEIREQVNYYSNIS